LIFGKARKVVQNHVQRDVTGTRQRSHSTEDNIGKAEKKLQQIPSRSLRSLTAANDLSKKLQSLNQQASQGDEDDSSNEASDDSRVSRNRSGEDWDSEYEERTSRKTSAEAHIKFKGSGQSLKRAREVIDDCQPAFSDDEDIADEFDIIEIGRDVFELSENKRKKRLKSKSQSDDAGAVLASPAPKEEPVMENEDTFTARQENLIAEDSNTSYQPLTVCR
jgi:hypothetical protein